MWVERTQAGIDQWHVLADQSAAQEARSRAILVGIVVTAIVFFGLWATLSGTTMTPGGRVVILPGIGGGVLVQSLFAAAFGAVSGLFVFRRSNRDERRKLDRQGLCMTCGVASADRIGTTCSCGQGRIVALSRIKWMDD